MTKKLNRREVTLHVGEDFDSVAKRVATAWHRAERGEEVSEHHVTFAAWSTISSVMTEKRYELSDMFTASCQERLPPSRGDIGRDYKRVHEDVKALVEVGLIERDHGTQGVF